MATTMAQATTKEITYVSIDKIKPNPNQPRKFFTVQSLEELAMSIKEHGILQPITIRFNGKNYELIAGERRLRAAKLAGLKFVPSILINIDMEKSSVLAIIENLQRENLNFIEEALGYQSLIKDYNYTQYELAKKIGKTQSTIANKLRLLKLDDGLKMKLLDNELTERHGRALLKLDDTEMQNKVLDKVITDNLNVSKTEKLIESILNKPEKPNKKIKLIFRDVKIFVNTINHAVSVMKKSGIKAGHEMIETEDGYKVIIDIKVSK